jgi:hypothetical protein
MLNTKAQSMTTLGGAMRAGGFLRGALRHAPHRALRGSGDLTRSATRSATHSAESGTHYLTKN